jgi:uncharacterized membrane protein
MHLKKAIPILLILFLFTGCDIKEYTPEIPIVFTQKATVTSGDFSFDCEICKTEDNVKVTILSTSAKGMTMTYNGSELDFTYDDYSYTIDGNEFEKTNVAIVIYETFECIQSENVNAKKIEGCYQYNGKISLGDFALIQNDDNSLQALSVRSANFHIEFN